MTDRFQFQPTDALVVVDVQNDFCPGGALAAGQPFVHHDLLLPS